MSGIISYENGLAAEASVARLYEAGGRTIAHRRWRGKSGEIDLVAREGARVVFIEVKQADSHAIAAERLCGRQIDRIFAAAREFVANEPSGQDTEMRFDVALVDRMGRIDILENALIA